MTSAHGFSKAWELTVLYYTTLRNIEILFVHRLEAVRCCTIFLFYFFLYSHWYSWRLRKLIAFVPTSFSPFWFLCFQSVFCFPIHSLFTEACIGRLLYTVVQDLLTFSVLGTVSSKHIHQLTSKFFILCNLEIYANFPLIFCLILWVPTGYRQERD